MTWLVGDTVGGVIPGGVSGETYARVTPNPASWVNGVASVWNPTITESPASSGRFVWSYVAPAAGNYIWWGEGSLTGEVVIEFDVLANPQSVTVLSPVLANGSIAGIVRGDDYTVANGTSLPIPLSGVTIPVGAVVVYSVYHAPNVVALSQEMTVSVAGPPAIVTLELTRRDTLRLPIGTSDTSIVMTESGGAVTTLVEGTITVVTVPGS